MAWMRGLGSFVVSGWVVVVLFAGGLGGVAAHEDPCEPQVSQFVYSGFPQPSPPGASLGVGPMALLRLETEAPVWGAGQWRIEVIHEDLGVVVANHGFGVWAAGDSFASHAVFEDEAVDLPGGNYRVEFSITGGFSPFVGTMTRVPC